MFLLIFSKGLKCLKKMTIFAINEVKLSFLNTVMRVELAYCVADKLVRQNTALVLRHKRIVRWA